MTLLAADIYRDYQTAGVPASGVNQPHKREIREWGTWLESLLGGGGPGLGYATRALLNADLAHAENTLAIVYADPVAANNGTYKKTGASGSGAWSRVADLPGDVLVLTVTGGTGNAIIATAPETPTVPGGKLYLMTPTANNTAAATIAVNGAAAVAIKNAFNAPLASGSLVTGSQVLMAWQTDHYQLLISAVVDGTAILADTITARDAAAASAAAAAANAAALGNQAYTFDSYAQAQAANVAVGIKSLRLMGYYAAGDAPTAQYFRVAAQPSTLNRVRSTDRFMPDGSTNSTNGGWWQMVLDELTDVRKYGVMPSQTATVQTTQLNGAIAAGSIVIPAAANYALNGDITIPMHRKLWVQTGATIINTGGRFTHYQASGGNIDFQIDGVMGFLATATAPSNGSTAGWDYNLTWANRGLIELGGTVAAIARDIKVHGRGEVYSDYVWPGTPPNAFTDMNSQMNRKGICLFNVTDGMIDGLDVHNIYGEAVYYQTGSAFNETNIKLTNNRVHDVAFNGINVNSFGGWGYVIANNYVQNAWQGIESSAGAVRNNFMINVYKGIISGGGGGAGPIDWSNNEVFFCHLGIDLEFGVGTIAENVSVTNNKVSNANAAAYIVDRISSFQVKNNISYAHALTSAGSAFSIGPNCTSGHIEGNIIRAPGPSSSGNVVNAAGSAVTIGTNPVF
jgi:hypothetical protein